MMQELSWGLPPALWLLATVPLLAGLRLVWSARARAGQRALGLGLPEQERWHGRTQAWIRQFLLWVGLAGVLLALARPRLPGAPGTVTASGANIVVLLDCSRSMLAKDLFPDRMQVARSKILDFLTRAPQHRIALMPFAAQPILRSPLTGDVGAVGKLLEECRPELFPVQGTAIGAAVQRAVDFLLKEGDRGRAILLLTDGADADQERVKAAAQAAAEEDIRIYALFLGDPERTVEVEIDGRHVAMAPQRSTVEQVATATGGTVWDVVVEDDRDLEELADRLQREVPAQPWQEQRRLVASEAYLWFLLPALACLGLGALMGTTRGREQS